MKPLSKILIAISIVIFMYVMSWGITIGLIKLITLCFRIKFNIAYATGLWLVLCLIKLLTTKSNNK